MQVIHLDVRKGEAKLKVQQMDDLWYLSHIIDIGDSVSGQTLRKIKIGGGEGADAGTGHVVELAAVEHDAYEPGFDGLGDALLEVVGVVGVDVAREVEDETTLDLVDLLQPDLQAIVFLVVESWNDLVVSHAAFFSPSRVLDGPYYSTHRCFVKHKSAGMMGCHCDRIAHMQHRAP